MIKKVCAIFLLAKEKDYKRTNIFDFVAFANEMIIYLETTKSKKLKKIS